MNALEFSEFSSDEEEHHEGDLLLGDEGTAGATGGPPPKKPVSVFGLVVISFFWVVPTIRNATKVTCPVITTPRFSAKTCCRF